MVQNPIDCVSRSEANCKLNVLCKVNLDGVCVIKPNLYPPKGYYCPDSPGGTRMCGKCMCETPYGGLDSCGSLCCSSSPAPRNGFNKTCYKKCPENQTSDGNGINWNKCYPINSKSSNKS